MVFWRFFDTEMIGKFSPCESIRIGVVVVMVLWGDYFIIIVAAVGDV